MSNVSNSFQIEDAERASQESFMASFIDGLILKLINYARVWYRCRMLHRNGLHSTDIQGLEKDVLAEYAKFYNIKSKILQQTTEERFLPEGDDSMVVSIIMMLLNRKRARISSIKWWVLIG